jgi:hypothetical protein
MNPCDVIEESISNLSMVGLITRIEECLRSHLTSHVGNLNLLAIFIFKSIFIKNILK